MSRDCDLIVLVADGDLRATVQSLLGRHDALGIRPVTLWRDEPLKHPQHDPGCFRGANDFLRPFTERAEHALVVFDRKGCGNDAPRSEIEAEVEARLARSGWQDRAAAIVIDPELESWVFSWSPHVPAVLGWKDASPPFRSWLIEAGLLEEEALKPRRPRETVERILRKVRKPRSSSIYGQLASKVSLQRCQDPAFIKLRKTLSQWFSDDASGR